MKDLKMNGKSKLSHAGYIQSTLISILVVVAIINTTTPAAGDTRKLRVLNDAYPRVFFFRQAEGLAAQNGIAYGQWEETFERLMGIEGSEAVRIHRIRAYAHPDVIYRVFEKGLVIANPSHLNWIYSHRMIIIKMGYFAI